MKRERSKRATTMWGIVCFVLAAQLIAAVTASASPPGRQWELVSPANKLGSSIEPITRFGALIQAAENGQRMTFVATGPTEAEPEGNRALEDAQVLATRAPDGTWSSRDIVTPNSEVGGILVGTNTEYKFFSEDLSRAITEPKGATPLPPLPANAEKTFYLRNNLLSTFEPIVSAANTLPEAHFGREIEFESASKSLNQVVFGSVVALTNNAVENGANTSLYMWQDGHIELLSVLPHGESPVTHELQSTLGYKGDVMRNAISTSGKRVVWSAQSGEQNDLYLRDTEKQETLQIDLPQAGASGEGITAATFEGANSEDTKIYFADEQQLTADARSGPGQRDLYVFELEEVDGKLGGKVVDLTKDHEEHEGAPEQAELQGIVLGYGEEAGQDNVFYMANGVLAAGASTGDCEGQSAGGHCNLYAQHFNGATWEAPRFVATLTTEEFPDWSGGNLNPEDLGLMTSRVSPNGRYVAFMSSSSLTGYDNDDAVSGHPDEEVFLYDATAHSLVCASCRGGSAPPEGVYDTGTAGTEPGLLVDKPQIWAPEIEASDHWLAGDIPGWTKIDTFHANYQSHYLLDSGQLFFNSSDALVPSAANHKMNVYEYRPEGSACSAATQSNVEVYRQESEGCVSLLSSGESAQESTFLDATPSGEDVFLLTSSKLSPLDVDTSFDVYDAHQCSGAEPCELSGTASASTACAEEASCRAAPSLYTETGAPASTVVVGDGNVVPTPAPAPAKKVVLTKQQELQKALKACKSFKRAKRRKSCEAAARKRYPVKAKKTKKSTKKKAK
jgi:hypothetical protein